MEAEDFENFKRMMQQLAGKAAEEESEKTKEFVESLKEVAKKKAEEQKEMIIKALFSRINQVASILTNKDSNWYWEEGVWGRAKEMFRICTGGVLDKEIESEFHRFEHVSFEDMKDWQRNKKEQE